MVGIQVEKALQQMIRRSRTHFREGQKGYKISLLMELNTRSGKTIDLRQGFRIAGSELIIRRKVGALGENKGRE